MPTAKQIIDIAARELGTTESPPNSNRQKYGAWFTVNGHSLNGYPWCMMFVQWVFDKAGAADLLPIKTASCSVLMSAAKKAGAWVTSAYKPGDVLIYNFGTPAKPQYHTGIVEAVSGQIYTAIEGNTSYGDDRNGGSVMRRNRYPRSIVGALRPRYSKEKPLTLIAQEVLDGKWGNGEDRKKRLTADGYDPATVQKLVNALYGSGIRAQVVASVLSIREKPDVDSRKMDTFGRGVLVSVEEVREGPGAEAWGRVGNGWISMDWVKVV